MNGKQRKWMLAAALAGVVTAAGGIGYAAIPSANGVVNACIGKKGTLEVIDAEAGATCKEGETAVALLGVNGKAADADKLDGKDSTDFVAAGAKVADADKLDGKDSTEFYAAGAKVADSDRLDGLEASSFFRTSTYRSLFVGSGSGGANELSSLSATCSAGDLLLTGGFLNLDVGSFVRSSSPANSTTWTVTWMNDDSPDSITVVAYCANQ